MKIFWTRFALDSLADIYKYYKNNVSETIAKKIRESVLLSTNQLKKFPLSGPLEKSLLNLNEGHRSIIRGNYKIIYKIQNREIYITDVFDSRQDPDEIRKRNE